MRKTLSIYIAIFLFGLVAIAQEYEIRLHRQAKVGQRYSLSAFIKEFSDMKMIVGGQLVETNREDFSVEYEATVSVLEIYANGTPSRDKHVVQKLTLIKAGERTTLLTNGTIVVASLQGKKPVFQIGGQPVEPNLYECLALVTAMGPEGPTDDEIFGTRERKRKGESWSINGELMKQSAYVPMEEVKGTATLKEVVKENGSDILVVVVKIVAKPSLVLPPGLSLKEGEAIMEMSRKFPADSSVVRWDDTLECSAKVIAAGKPRLEGPEVQMRAISKQSIRCNIALLK